MTTANGINTIEDVIRVMNNFLSETDKKLSEYKLNERAAALLTSADNPEDVFKSKLIISYIEQLRRISTNISSMNKPAAGESAKRDSFR